MDVIKSMSENLIVNRVRAYSKQYLRLLEPTDRLRFINCQIMIARFLITHLNASNKNWVRQDFIFAPSNVF